MKVENIKFKAKRLDGKGWAIGDLLHSYENGAIIVPIEGGGAFSVDPSTVCQFTGLKDMKDEEIWEHDLLVESSSLVILEFKWNSNRCCYSLYIEGTNALVEHNFAEYPVNNYRVLGNRFDRKEAEK